MRVLSGVYSAPLANALYFDGSAGSVSFLGAGFAGKEATVALRTLAVSDVVKRQLVTLAAVGLGTISITSVGGVYGLSLTI